jgi:hypothetical protein
MEAYLAVPKHSCNTPATMCFPDMTSTIVSLHGFTHVFFFGTSEAEASEHCLRQKNIHRFGS